MAREALDAHQLAGALMAVGRRRRAGSGPPLRAGELAPRPGGAERGRGDERAADPRGRADGRPHPGAEAAPRGACGDLAAGRRRRPRRRPTSPWWRWTSAGTRGRWMAGGAGPRVGWFAICDHDDEAAAQRAVRAGAAGVIRKPFKPTEVAAQVRTLLEVGAMTGLLAPERVPAPRPRPRRALERRGHRRRPPLPGRAERRARSTSTSAPGEVLALMGSNGAGKSTLLRLLATADRPDGGRVTWWGDPPAAPRPSPDGVRGRRAGRGDARSRRASPPTSGAGSGSASRGWRGG